MEWVGVIVASGLVGSVIGSIVTHWLDGRGDSNTAFNDIADHIRLRFEKHSANPSLNRRILGDDVLLLRNHMGLWQRKKYDKAIAKYESAIGDGNWNTEEMEPKLIDPELVVKACRDVIKAIRRR